MKVNKLLYGFSMLGLLTTVACGGSSSSSGSTVDGGATTADLRSLSTVPDFDVDSLDVASASDASVSRGLTRTFGEVGSFSRAGCEMRMQLEEIKAHVEQQQFDKCIIETLETTEGLTIVENGYGFYSMDFSDLGEEMDGPSGMNIRVKIGLNNDRLEMFVCESGDGDTYTQTNYTRFAVNDSGQFDVFSKGVHEEGDFGTFGQELQSYLPDKSIEDFVAGDEASVTGAFNGPWGGGSIAVQAVNDGTLKNIVEAAFQSGGEGSDWGSWTTQAYGETNDTEGCAKFSSTGEYPAMVAGQVMSSEDLTAGSLDGEDLICWVEFSEETNFEELSWPADFVTAANDDGNCTFEDSGTECFSYSADEDDSLISLIASSDDVEYFADVDGNDLSAQSDPTIAFAGDEVWDCEAESEFTAVVSNADEAEALLVAVEEACAEPSFDRESTPCFDQESEQYVEDEGHELLPPEEDGDEIDPTNYLAVCTEETIEDDCAGLGDNKVCGGEGDSFMCTITCTVDADCDPFDNTVEGHAQISCLPFGDVNVCLFDD